MQEQRIRQLQEEANQAYDRLPSTEAGGYLQATLMAQVAINLVHVTESLDAMCERMDKRVEQLDSQNALLLRIAIAIESLNAERYSPENNA